MISVALSFNMLEPSTFIVKLVGASDSTRWWYGSNGGDSESFSHMTSDTVQLLLCVDRLGRNAVCTSNVPIVLPHTGLFVSMLK